jgi:DNA-binding transcriptional MerR regulator
MNTKPLTIGRLAQTVGVGIDTVRFYERAGLLPAADRSPAGYRLFGAAAVARMQFIRRARALGFSLDDAAELLKLADGGTRASVRRVAQRRLDEIEARLRELGALREALSALVDHCNGRGAVDGCPIIEALVPPARAAAPVHAPARRVAG